MVRTVRVVPLCCVLFLLVPGSLPGQVRSSTFGPIDLHPLPVRVSSLLTVRPSDDETDRIVVLSASGGKVYDISVDRGGQVRVRDSLSIPFPFTHVRTEQSSDHRPIPTFLLRSDSLVLYTIGDADGTGLSLRKVAAPDRSPGYIFVADLNGDGREDLLLIDPEEPGILPLYAVQRGGWRAGKVAAPDLQVSRVATVHLNNDGLVDILAYDWVRSEVHLVYGVGRERFLDQGGFAVDGSIDRILVDPVNPRHPLRVTMVDKDHSDLRYFEMDERGDLVLVTRQTVRDTVRSVYRSHDDSTSVSSFILVADSSLSIIHDAYVAQTPSLSTVSLPGRVLTSRFPDKSSVAFLLRGSVYARVWQYGSTAARGDSIVLALPAQPIGVVVRDYDQDGNDDMAFVSGRSGVISFVWGRSDGRFAGTEDLEGPERPRTVIGQMFGGPHAIFYSTHESPSSISITEIEWQDQTVTTSRIPVQGKTELIGEIRSHDGSTTLSAIHRAGGGRVTFATYERIRQDSFLEQTIDLGPPAVLFGASVGFVDADSVPDAILMYRPDDSSAVLLGISYGDSTTNAPSVSVRTPVPVRDPRVAYMWQTDVNADSLADMVVVFPATAREVYVLLSRPDSLYARALLVDSLVAVQHRQQFAVYDADGDALPDLFAVVGERGGLGWWRNTGGGGFAAWQLLIRADDISGFAFGSLLGPDHTDLVVTRSRMNLGVVYDGRSMPWGRK